MSAAHFKDKTRRRCFFVNVSLKGTDRPQKRVVKHFHFIFPIMPVKAAYMSAVLLCVQLLTYQRSCYLLLKRHLVAESEFAFSVLSSDQINVNCFYAANKVVNVKVNVPSKKSKQLRQ